MMLKQVLLMLSMISISCIAGYECLAQKAFEVIVYKGKIPGTGSLQFDLADGYLPASILRLEKSKNKTLKFTPSTPEPDSSGKWIFEPIVPSQQKQRIVLFFNQKELVPHLRIPAEYIKVTKRSKIVLKRQNP